MSAYHVGFWLFGDHLHLKFPVFFLQVSVLYALQVFCHSHNFPKGTVKVIYTERSRYNFCD